MIHNAMHRLTHYRRHAAQGHPSQAAKNTRIASIFKKRINGSIFLQDHLQEAPSFTTFFTFFIFLEKHEGVFWHNLRPLGMPISFVLRGYLLHLSTSRREGRCEARPYNALQPPRSKAE